jgi:hypothetical protein
MPTANPHAILITLFALAVNRESRVGTDDNLKKRHAAEYTRVQKYLFGRPSYVKDAYNMKLALARTFVRDGDRFMNASVQAVTK